MKRGLRLRPEGGHLRLGGGPKTRLYEERIETTQSSATFSSQRPKTRLYEERIETWLLCLALLQSGEAEDPPL